MKIFKIASPISPYEGTDTHIALIEDILRNNFDPYAQKYGAYYDAIFPSEEGHVPYFIIISSSEPGMGYIVFLDFLKKVQEGNYNNFFISTPFTEDGKKMFEKVANSGLIKFIAKIGRNETQWEVVGNAKSVLEQMLSNYKQGWKSKSQDSNSNILECLECGVANYWGSKNCKSCGVKFSAENSKERPLAANDVW